MRWPCGPLDIERERRREGFTPAEADALRQWSEPRALELLAGTPVSCLVVTWAEGRAGDGEAEDEEHQRAIAPLIAAARWRGLSVVGWAGERADLRRAAEAAFAAGLDALATTSTESVPGIGVLRFREHGSGDRSPTGFLGVSGAVWPGMKVDPEGDVDASSGPTGPPWIDSNAWYVRLVRTLVRPETLWLSFDPPQAAEPLSPAAYVQAIADTEIYGARWVVSLDPHLRQGLSEGRASAVECWAEIARSLDFFEAHRGWTDYRPVGHLGVVSDFSGENEFLSFEVLNLLARQSSLYRILEKTRALADPLDGLHALLYVDEAPAESALLRGLYAFAESGGTLIAPPGWEARGEPADDAWLPGFRVFRYGTGRLAIAREELTDPQRLAEDAQLLMSHRHDPVRLFNPGTAVSHYATSEDGGSGVLHLLRFATRPFRMPITAWFRKPWSSGRTWRHDAFAAEPTERTAVRSGVEFHLPSVSVYSVLEVSA